MKKKLFVAGACLLLVFQSCNNEELSQGNTQMMKTETSGDAIMGRAAAESQTLQGFVANQLAIDAEIKAILDSETNVDYSMIQAGLEKVQTTEELEQLYRDANVNRAEELISLYNELNLHSEAFIKSNPDFYSNNTEEVRTKLITAEIDAQIGYSDDSAMMKANCHANFVKASKRCMRNYAITMSFAAVSGFISFGASTVVGAAAATAVMIACNADADEDYHDCVQDGGTP
ncbi:hypothetical protein CHRYSEOSP005_06270 [Chryseobacterium sp. Alg-005]|uniref:hypothetical protein n=1 Tax=Chryseobacterium sp. Alg-005 TaxID=3159516 RepID=UPI0035557BF5